MYPWTLRLVRGQGRSQSRGRDSAIWRTTSGDASRNQRTRLGTLLFRVRVLLVASTWYDPFPIFRRSSAFYFVKRSGITKKNYGVVLPFLHMFFRGINRFLQTRKDRITKVYQWQVGGCLGNAPISKALHLILRRNLTIFAS